MKTIRILSLALAVATLLGLSVGVCSASAADSTPTSASIVSNVYDVVGAAGKEIGDVPSSHGQNQTRIVAAESGVYMALLTGDSVTDKESGAPAYEMSLIRRTPDGKTELLYSEMIIGTSTTATAMVDKDGNVWLYSGWAEMSGLFVMNVWNYDVATGTIEKYQSKQKAKGGGYSIAVIDPAYGSIYAIFCGDLYFSWCAFNIETKEWAKIQSVRTNQRYCYHFGYGDGKGGFFIVNERDVANGDVFSNLEGVRVAEAMRTYRSRKIDAGYMWDEGNLFYIPNALEKDYTRIVITPVIYDVEKGVYPNWTNGHNDLFYDAVTGLVYVACAYDDNEVPGHLNHIYVLDANNNFEMVSHKVLPYLQGEDSSYFHRFYQDNEGNLWLMLTNGNDAYLEIWQGTGELKDDFRLAYNEKIADSFSYGDSILVAGSRGGSIPSDVARGIMRYRDTWFYMDIDFAALRVKVGLDN